MKTIESTAQALEVAKRYLEKRGYASVAAVRGTGGPSAWLSAVDPDDGSLAVVKVSLARGASRGFPAEDHSRRARAEAEAVAVAHLASLEGASDTRVRFDLVCLVPVGEGRAFVRHHVDAFGSD